MTLRRRGAQPRTNALVNSMKRLWCSIATSIAAALTALGVEAESPDAPTSSAMGHVVDADVPATYRLPPVPISPQAAPSVWPVFVGPQAKPPFGKLRTEQAE